MMNFSIAGGPVMGCPFETQLDRIITRIKSAAMKAKEILCTALSM
jgi:hypothetical protein